MLAVAVTLVIVIVAFVIVVMATPIGLPFLCISKNVINSLVVLPMDDISDAVGSFPTITTDDRIRTIMPADLNNQYPRAQVSLAAHASVPVYTAVTRSPTSGSASTSGMSSTNAKVLPVATGVIARPVLYSAAGSNVRTIAVASSARDTSPIPPPMHEGDTIVEVVAVDEDVL